MSDERQYAFFRIATAMGETYELERMRDVLNQMRPGQLEKMIDEAIERGVSKVMITDKAYIGFDLDKTQSSNQTAKEE